MSLDQYDFVSSLNLAYYKYVRDCSKARQITSENHVYKELLLAYARMLTYLLNCYFSITTLSDENFCTEEEAQFALDALNEIFGADLYVDFEIISLDYTSNVWDDTLIWNDTNVWVD